MSITLNISDEVLERIKRAAGTDSAEEAVTKVLEEYARLHSQKDLIQYLGTFEDMMTLEELHEMRRMD